MSSRLRPVDSEAAATELLLRGQGPGHLDHSPRVPREISLRGERVVLQLAVDGRDGPTQTSCSPRPRPSCVAPAPGSPPSPASPVAPPLSVKVWTRFNPEGRSALFLVPGLAAYLMAIAAVLLTALAIATEWERGSMEQLFASPVGRLEIVLGKLLPYLVIGVLQLLLVLSVGHLGLRRAHPRQRAACSSAPASSSSWRCSARGCSSRSSPSNQLVATQAGALSSLLPSLLLSGFVFPIENMPRVLQVLSSVIPARYMVHALRGVMLKGTGLGELWPTRGAGPLRPRSSSRSATARFRRKLA